MKLNISIDDLTPRPKSGLKVLDRAYELIAKFPDIKFTLFIPTAYMRQGEKSYPISEYPDFCDALKKLGKKNFELGWHGHFHGIKDKASNSEFIKLDYTESCNRFDMMFSEAKKAGLYERFVPIMRPPAFKMSAKAIRAAWDKGIKILSLSPHGYAQQSYQGEHKKSKGKVLYYTSNPPHDPLKLYAENIVMYHACEWDKNYLSTGYAAELRAFIDKNQQYLKFCFMWEL